MEQKRSIRASLLRTCAVFALVLATAIGGLGFYTFFYNIGEQYQRYISDILTYSQYGLDVDELGKNIENEEWSKMLEREKQLLDDVKATHKIEFIYIVKPLNTGDVDIMQNIVVGETANEIKKYGRTEFLSLTGDAYSSELVARYMEAAETHETTFFYNKTEEYGYMYTGVMPLVDTNGKNVALLCVDVSVNDIQKTARSYIRIVLVGVLVLTILFILALYKWMSKRIIRPIADIEKAAKEFVELSHENDDPEQLVYHKPSIHTEDEMEVLSEAVATMTEDLKKYMVDLLKETAEKERIGAELDVATKIQASALPNIFPAYPECKEFDIYASMDAAKEVGGDFYDFFKIDEEHLGLVVADVSGKGVPAALFMMASKIMIKNHASITMEPAEVLTQVNNQLCEGNEAEMFVTVWFAVLEISTGKIKAANAGHEYPAICRKGGEFELFKDKHDFVLAGMEDYEYSQYDMQLLPGDRLFLYTDGVPEATNADNELFGTDRMLEWLNKDKDVTPEQLAKKVREGVDLFVKDAPQFDDLTMLAITYWGEEKHN